LNEVIHLTNPLLGTGPTQRFTFPRRHSFNCFTTHASRNT